MTSQTICTIEQLAPLLAARATRFHATSRVVARRCPPARSRRARPPFPRRAVHARGMSDPSSSSGGDAAGDRVMADASRALTAYAGVPTSVASGDAQGEVRPAPTGFHRASAASSNSDRFPSRVRRFVEPRPVSIARPPPFRLVHPSPAARSDADRPVTSLGHSWTSTTSFRFDDPATRRRASPAVSNPSARASSAAPPRSSPRPSSARARAARPVFSKASAPASRPLSSFPPSASPWASRKSSEASPTPPKPSPRRTLVNDGIRTRASG